MNLWNRLIAASRKLAHSTGLARVPAALGIELTNVCNLRCAMCPIHTMKRPAGHMPIPLFRKICDESRRYRMPISWLSFFGDPLLYPMLEEALVYFQAHGYGDAGISTNGVLMDEQRVRVLVKHAKLVRVALDSTREEVYRVLRNNEHFRDVCENTRRLINEARGSSLRIEIQYLRTRLNADEGLEAFERMFGRHPHVTYFFKDCGVYASGGPDYTVHSGGEFSCDQPFGWLNILSDGRAVLCCRDLDGIQSVGNVNQDSLWEVWNGRRARWFRRRFVRREFGRLPLCRACFAVNERRS